MTAVKLALLELRRFRGVTSRAVALACLMAVPVMYGLFYLVVHWDVENDLAVAPVAVINADEGVKIDGRDINAGVEFIQQLTDEKSRDWRVVSAEQAKKGIDSGQYYFSVTIPADFTHRILSAAIDTTNSPVTIGIDDTGARRAGNYEDAIRTGLRSDINLAAFTVFAKTQFHTLDNANTELLDIRDTTTALTNTAPEIRTTATTLSHDITSFEKTARSIAEAINQRNNTTQNSYVELITDLPAIQQGTKQGADLTNRAANELTAIHTQWCKKTPQPDTSTCEQLQQLVTDMRSARPNIEAANTAVQELSTNELSTKAAHTQQLADKANKLADDLSTASNDATDIVTGSDDLAEYSTNIATTMNTIVTALPSTTSSDNRDLASNFGNLTTFDHTKTDANRTSLSILLAVSIWVFALTAYMLFRPVNPRALAGRVNAFTVAFAGWVPAILVGTIAAVLLYGVADLGFGLRAANIPGTLIATVVAVAVFTAIAHFFRLAFSRAGDLVLIALLVLQLTVVSSSYQIAGSSPLHSIFGPFLPMTYIVDAIQITVSGGSTATWWLDMGMACMFGAIAVTVSTLVVARRRRWNPSRLHSTL